MTIPKDQAQVILMLAGEGGGYTVLGAETAGRWKFWVEAGGGDSWLYDDEDVTDQAVVKVPASEPQITYFETLDEVMGSLNAAWPSLRPLRVHPSFAKHLMARVEEYIGRHTEGARPVSTSRWRRVCGQTWHPIPPPQN